MATVDVKVPQLSESVAEATLLQWKKKPGDAVAMDEILIEIETDKVVLEVPAPADGVLSELVVTDGGTVTSDQLIARIDTEGKASAAAPAQAPAAAAAPAPAATPASASSKAGVAMPAAAKMMADQGMAPGSVQGTGRFMLIGPSSACRCRACARVWPSGCCSRKQRTPSSRRSTKSTWPR